MVDQVDELAELIRRAQARDTAAYDRLVRRFQHMAVGYAYAFLGDFHMAEDAAQETFLQVFLDLPALRQPLAFAGWLRRIVFKCCDRATRRRSLPTVTLEAAVDAVIAPNDPAATAERTELHRIVRSAIAAQGDGVS